MKREVCAAIASLSVMALSLCLTSTQSKASPSERGNYRSDAALNAHAANVARHLDARIGKSPNFGGVAIRSSGLEVKLVDLTGITGELEEARAAAPVEVTTAQYSWQQLLDATKVLDKNAMELQGSGIPITTWGPDFDSNRVVVTLSAKSGNAQKALESLVGEIVTVSDRLLTPEPAGRENDISPFYGGNHIVSSAGRHCSSWFPASVNGTARQLTASHCQTGTWKVASGGSMGATVRTMLGGTVDAQTIPGSGSGKVWSTSTAYRSVVGYTNSNYVGERVCTSGYVNLEVCNVEIYNPSISVSYSGVTLTDTVYAKQVGQLAAFTPGNSGGPVYVINSNGSVTARGMIYARGNSDNATGFYGKVGNILSYFGASLKSS